MKSQKKEGLDQFNFWDDVPQVPLGLDRVPARVLEEHAAEGLHATFLVAKRTYVEEIIVIHEIVYLYSPHFQNGKK